MYSVGCRNGDQKPDVQLLRYNKNFSKKPIQQLAVVPEYQLLISLSGNDSYMLWMPVMDAYFCCLILINNLTSTKVYVGSHNTWR